MSNRVTPDQFLAMPHGERAALPVDQLHLLQEDVSALDNRLKAFKTALEAALLVRFAEHATAQRRVAGKDSGKVTLAVGEFVVACDLPKKPKWDQDKLVDIEAQLLDMGEPVSDYLTVERKVSERAYTSWPASLRTLFEPARTLEFGKPTFKIEPAKAGGQAA